MAYDSEHAWDFADRIFEFVSYMAIDESANLAQERGAYAHFKGSEWSKGKVPIDTMKKVEDERGSPVTIIRDSRHKGLNWDVLRGKVAKGMRNATLMAVAPNANIGLVVGTTPGIDARFAQVFSRNKISGKYLDLNHNLVKDLRNMGIWEKVKDLIIEHQGDIADIPGIPQYIKDIYKTSFTTSPYAYIEVAARAQKWVDQALSRNMYLETRDIDETMKIYMTAWEKGLKSTYYLHMKPRHTAEQSTVKINKAEKMGKTGFSSVARAATPAPVAAAALEIKEAIVSPMSDAVTSAISANGPVGVGFARVSPAANLFTAAAKEVKEKEGEIEMKAAPHATIHTHSHTHSNPHSHVVSKETVKKTGSSYMPLNADILKKPAQGKTAPKVCPIDPAERAQCDSCQ